MKSTGKKAFVITAVQPWNSVYRDDQECERHTTDTQEEIDFCLNNCPYASSECCNCLSGGKPKQNRSGPKGKIDVEQLKEMLRLKTPTTTICKELGIRPETLYRKKKKLGAV